MYYPYRILGISVRLVSIPGGAGQVVVLSETCCSFYFIFHFNEFYILFFYFLFYYVFVLSILCFICTFLSFSHFISFHFILFYSILILFILFTAAVAGSAPIAKWSKPCRRLLAVSYHCRIRITHAACESDANCFKLVGGFPWVFRCSANNNWLVTL